MNIKKSLQILPLLALSLLSSCGSKTNAPADSGVPDGYTLEWSDEFDGSELDDTIWTALNGGGGWGNNELEYYQKDNATVADGHLTITAKKETVGIEPIYVLPLGDSAQRIDDVWLLRSPDFSPRSKRDVASLLDVARKW
jgi:hypothetical protein